MNLFNRIRPLVQPRRWRPHPTALALLLVFGFVLPGCGASLIGGWRMLTSMPNREAFAIDELHFHSDGSYAATVTIDGHTKRELGLYEFTGWKLHFRPEGGGQRSFEATVKLDELELVDKERKMLLKKAGS